MVIDVTEQDFEREVIERSREVPVVVDFWAEWCGPCRQLSPALEHAAAKREGRVVLAKVDTDANQGLSTRYGIRGIPAVKAFRDGEVVAEFVGAKPGPAVERFFDGIVPSEADELVAQGDEQSLRRALELDPANAAAAVALASILMQRGELEESIALVEPLAGNIEAEGLAARIRLVLSGAAERDPNLSEAIERLDSGDIEAALERLAGAVESADDGETRDLIRKLMVGIFNQLGSDHPLSVAYRRRLAAALY